jgi:hypothetical protein
VTCCRWRSSVRLTEQAIVFVVVMGSVFAMRSRPVTGSKIPVLQRRAAQVRRIALADRALRRCRACCLRWRRAEAGLVVPWRSLMAELLFVGAKGAPAAVERDLNNMSLVLAIAA